jgi:peptidoglycan/LPS O-acetylase OafA/YrhL
MSHRRVFGLDLLRVCAITLVLCGHSRLFLSVVWPDTTEMWSVGGAGVDLFFVLSRFLVGGILFRDLERGASFQGLGNFWSRRWWRTLPNYLLFLGINTLVYLWLGNYRISIKRYLTFTQCFAWQGPFAYGESWSLCVEEWFYLLFPAIAFAVMGLGASRKKLLGAAFLLAFASFAVRWAFILRQNSPFTLVQHATVCRLDSLMFGVVAAYLARYVPEFWHRIRWFALGIGLPLLILCLAFRIRLPNEGIFMRGFYFDVIALAVALLLPALSSWRDCPGIAAKSITAVSLWSYSIYLVNRPLREIMLIKILRPESLGVGIMFAIFWVAATLFLSWLCYTFFEIRMTEFRDFDWAALCKRLWGTNRRNTALLETKDE